MDKSDSRQQLLETLRFHCEQLIPLVKRSDFGMKIEPLCGGFVIYSIPLECHLDGLVHVSLRLGLPCPLDLKWKPLSGEFCDASTGEMIWNTVDADAGYCASRPPFGNGMEKLVVNYPPGIQDQFKEPLEIGGFRDLAEYGTLRGRRQDVQKCLEQWVSYIKGELGSDEAADSHQNERSPEEDYLGIGVVGTYVTRNNKTEPVDFKSKGLPLNLFVFLVAAGAAGMHRDELAKKLFSKPTTPNAIEQHKAAAERVISSLGLYIDPDGCGVWRLRANDLSKV